MSKKTEGVVTVYDYDEMEEGKSYIMVSEDAPLIDPATDTLVEAKTGLKSVELEQNTRKPVKRYTNDAYAKAMEEELGGIGEKSKVVLLLYVKAEIELDEEGRYDPNKIAKHAAIKEKLSKKSANTVSLNTQKVFSSEYEAPVNIKKKVGTSALKRRRVEGIADFLDKEGEGDDSNLSTKDAVRKRQREKNEEAELNDQSRKVENYGRAVKNAKRLTEDAFLGRDEYDEIEEVLNRQRRAAISSTKRGEELVREMISKEPPKPEPILEDGVVITDLNFIKAIPSTKQQREYQEQVVKNTSFSLKDARSGTTSVVNVPLPTEVLGHIAPGYSSCVPSSFPTSAKPESAAGKVEVRAEVEPLTKLEEGALDELLIGKGVGNVIKLLRERKLLGQTMYVGRSKESTAEGELEKFQKAGVKGGEAIDLDYRDESGYKMSLKEAWRVRSRKFHGGHKSKKKLEKQMIKREIEMKKRLSDQTKDSKLSQALKKTQQEKNVAYMRLEAKKHIIF
eukprot:TRINITY_DN7873_c0_g2_i1.p1 TRINITY_DN7873_c0_g2~~TRINITY_DN7873_c0_g2_i1.p1  ORF type:complete len:507 (+),score=191.23 TRINITY_DN7873_c0_g2_i1:155-1675(+)